MTPRVHELAVQVRFSDTDLLGHLNNGSYAAYTELGRIALFEEAGIPGASLILARLAIDFRRQVRLGERVTVRSWVTTIGRSSISMRQDVLADGVVAATTSSVIVHFDYAANAPVAVPDDLRARLAPYIAAEPGPGGDAG